MIKTIIKLAIRLKLIILFSSILVVYSETCPAQIIDNCNVIKAFLDSKKSNDIFGLSKNTELPIILYDKKGLISKCSFPPVYNRKVLVSQDTLDEIVVSPANFIIYNIGTHRNKIKLGIHFKSSGAHGTIEMKKKKRSIKIKKFDIGFF